MKSDNDRRKAVKLKHGEGNGKETHEFWPLYRQPHVPGSQT